jgi:hypothetical protein
MSAESRDPVPQFSRVPRGRWVPDIPWREFRDDIA